MSTLKKPIPTDKYNGCNHHHEIDPNCQSLVDFGTGEFIADNHMVPLLAALNSAGLMTRTHNYCPESGYSFLAISLDSVTTVSLTEVSREHLSGSNRELLIVWNQEPGHIPKSPKFRVDDKGLTWIG